MLKAYLHPKKKPNDRHWYAYDVAFDGEIIVTDSRDPEHDLERPPCPRHQRQDDATRREQREGPNHHRHGEGRALVRWQQPRKVQMEGTSGVRQQPAHGRRRVSGTSHNARRR